MDLAADLRALREKYERMVDLRELHARARADAEFQEPDPRPALLALAARFPGALRELDRLPLETIRGRIAELALGELDPSRVTPWMRAQIAFHRLARGAIAAKKWLGRRREVTHAMQEELAASGPPEAREWVDELAALARPPAGRILEVVFARADRELGLEPGTVRALVFG